MVAPVPSASQPAGVAARGGAGDGERGGGTGRRARPDVVFFMMDQLSARWFEGEQAVAPTPNFDRLRARGVSFSQAFANCPLCVPARSTLATGLSLRGHGALQNGYALDPALPTFMQALQQAGWRTGAFGKVHVRPHYEGVHPDYRAYGFDVVRNTEDPRAGEWLDWVARAHPGHYEAALATIWAGGIPELAAYGPERLDLRPSIERLRKDFRWATDAFPASTAAAYTLPFPEEVSQTAWITGHALDFIRQTPAEQPLYAHISYVQPHSPFCAPESRTGRVDPAALPAPAPVEWLEDACAPRWFHGAHPRARVLMTDERAWRHLRHLYFADITYLDDQLGRVVAALEAARRLDTTYLVLLADHGELLLDHGFLGKGEFHYDACIRVPLVIAGPGIRGGAGCAAIAQHQDVYPTVLEMAGLSAPRQPIIRPGWPPAAQAERSRPGRSLLPWCRGETPGGWREAAYVESYNNIDSGTPDRWARTVRTRDWRYTLYPGSTGEQLFAIREDPQEQRNLAADPGCAAVRRELRDLLLDQVILQDFPHPPRDLFALDVH